MPFVIPWTDRAHEPGFVDEFLAFHEGALAGSRTERWAVHLIAFADGRPIGSQAVTAEHFAQTRSVSTASWLGAHRQGRGLGTEMRAAVLELAFEGLGAETAHSGALAGNGELVGETVLRRERAGWRSPVPVEITDLDAVRPFRGATLSS